MAEKLTWTLNVQVAGGPVLAGSATMDVDAYDMIAVTVPNGADKAVEIQPGGAGRVQFLAIVSSGYGAGLTYKLDPAAATGFAIDQPAQAFIGPGAVGLLPAAPTTIHFSNHLDHGVDANIQVLVGRNTS